MKPIKEQYKEIVCGWNEERTENVANRCTEIADDYAIEFAEWLRVNYYDNGELWIEWNSDDNTHSSKELLEIFKKEKGL